MVFFNVCDTLSFHPKALVAGNAAMGLWVRAGSWVQDVLTDGQVPAEMARALGTPAEIKRLVAAGLWVPNETGYAFHDFAEVNRSKDRVKADKAAGKERQAKWRQARAAAAAAQGVMFNEDEV